MCTPRAQNLSQISCLLFILYMASKRQSSLINFVSKRAKTTEGIYK